MPWTDWPSQDSLWFLFPLLHPVLFLNIWNKTDCSKWGVVACHSSQGTAVGSAAASASWCWLIWRGVMFTDVWQDIITHMWYGIKFTSWYFTIRHVYWSVPRHLVYWSVTRHHVYWYVTRHHVCWCVTRQWQCSLLSHWHCQWKQTTTDRGGHNLSLH